MGDTFSNSVKKVPVEVLHKPVSRKTLVDTIEHRQVYQQLKSRNIDTKAFRKGKFNS